MWRNSTRTWMVTCFAKNLEQCWAQNSHLMNEFIFSIPLWQTLIAHLLYVRDASECWGWEDMQDLRMGFPGGLVVKNPPANAGDIRDTGSIPVSGRSPGGGNGNPLQCSCLGNPMDRGSWRATVHGVMKSWTWLSDWAHLRSRSLAGKTGSSLTMQPGKHCHEVTEKAEWARLPNTSNREQIMKDEELGQMQWPRTLLPKPGHCAE